MNINPATIIATMGLVMFACGSVRAAPVVLSGMPSYTYSIDSDEMNTSSISELTMTAVDDPYAIAYDSPGEQATDGTWLSGTPTYRWWYGCSPTAAGMIIGYWDSLEGYEDLFYGDASIWYGNGNSGTKRMVASTMHIVAGIEKGYTYGYYGNTPMYPDHLNHPDCIADFLHTTNGNTPTTYISTGLKNFIEWTDTSSIPLKAGYACSITDNCAPAWEPGGTLGIETITTEIDAGRPLLASVRTSFTTSSSGHSIVLYGYQADMFQVRVQTGANTYENLTVYGVAVRDTWSDGTGSSTWYDWDGNTFTSYIDSDGVEWWPFVCYTSYSYEALPDWMFNDVRTINIWAVPEPSTLLLAPLGLLGLLAWRKKIDTC